VDSWFNPTYIIIL